MASAMTNTMLYVVLENLSDRILSSAMVERTRAVARYAPIMPVRMAASAVIPATARPTGPITLTTA